MELGFILTQIRIKDIIIVFVPYEIRRHHLE